jgi:hypothetical protein
LALGVLAAVTSKMNIGLRHILPLYPLVFLVAAKAVSELLAGRRKTYSVALVALCLYQFVESARIYPHYLAYFNQLAGGPGHGHEFLVDSNLDWGQDLKGLKEWMDAHEVKRINLSYFGTADPAYYGIECTHLYGAPFFAKGLVGKPRLPGYVAVSLTNLRFGTWYFEPLLQREPVAVIGYSIYVYWMDRPWW